MPPELPVSPVSPQIHLILNIAVLKRQVVRRSPLFYCQIVLQCGEINEVTLGGLSVRLFRCYVCVCAFVCGGGVGVDAIFIIMDLCFIYEQNFKRIHS